MDTQYNVGYSVNVNAGSSIATLEQLAGAFGSLQKNALMFGSEKNDQFFSKATKNIGRLNTAIASFGKADKNFSKKQFEQRLNNFTQLTNAFNTIAQGTTALTPDKLRGFATVTNSVAKAMQTINSIQGTAKTSTALTAFADSFGSMISVFNRVKDLSLNGVGSKITSMTNTVTKAMTTLGSVNVSKTNLKNARNAMGILRDYNNIVASGTGVKPLRSYSASLNSMATSIAKLGGADMQGAFKNITKMFGKLHGMEKRGGFDIWVDPSQAVAAINEVGAKVDWLATKLRALRGSLRMMAGTANRMAGGAQGGGMTTNATTSRPIGFQAPGKSKSTSPTDSVLNMPYMGKKGSKAGKGPASFSPGVQNISTGGVSGPMSWAQYKATLKYPTGFGVSQERRYQAWSNWARGGAMKYPEFMGYVNENATLQEWYSRLFRENAASRATRAIKIPHRIAKTPAPVVPTTPTNISTGSSGPMTWTQHKGTLRYPIGFGAGQEQRYQVGFVKTNTSKGPTDSYVAMPEMSKKGSKVGKGPTSFYAGPQNILTGSSGPMSWEQYKNTLRYPIGFGAGQEQRYQAWAKWARGGAMKYPEFMGYVNGDATLQGWYSRLARENAASRMVKTINTPPYRGLLPSGAIPLDYSRLVQASGMRFNDFKKLYPLVAREEVLRYWRTAQATMKATPRSTATTPYSAPIGLLPSPTEATKLQTASQMRFNEWRKLYPAMPKNEALNYWHSARAAANVSSAGPIAMGSTPSAASSTAKAQAAKIIPPFQKTAGKYGARGSMIPRNVGYKVLGPSMLDSGGLGVASFLKGMGMMYGVMGAFSAFGNALNDYTAYNNTMQTAMNILHAHDTENDFYGRFGGMANTVRRVGVETKFTAPQVADAAKFLAMAGYSIKDINNSIRPIADIALVGDTELGQTADLMTNVMTAYKIKPNQLRQAADIMTNTFTMSNTTLTEMAEAYKYSAGLLAGNNVSFQESAAALGILGNAGIKGSQAGTTMRTIIANLLNPTKKQATEWERLGITTRDSNGNLRNILDVFGDLSKISGDVNVYKIFHKTAAQGAAALIDQVDRWNEIVAQNFLSDGMVSKLAEAKKNTISGLWAQLTSMFTEDAIRSFEGVNGTIVNFLKSGINALDPNSGNGNAESIRRSITQVVGLLDNVKDISAAIFKTWEHIGGFVTTFWKIQMIAAPLLFGLRSVKSLFNLGAGVVAMAGSIGNFAGGVGMATGQVFKNRRARHLGGRSVLSGMFGTMPGVSRSRYAMPGVSKGEMYWNGYWTNNQRAMTPRGWRYSSFVPGYDSHQAFAPYATNPTKENAQAYWAYRNSMADPDSSKRSSHFSHLRALAARRQTLMPVFGGIGGMLGMGLGGWGGSELALSMGAEQGGGWQMVGALGGAAVGTAVGTKAIGALGNVVAFAPWVAGVLAVSALAGVGIYKLYKAHQATKKFTQENIEWTKQMYGDVSMIGLDSSQQMNKYLKVLNDSQSSLNEKTENYIKLLKEQLGLTPKTDNLTGLPLSQIDPEAYNRAEETYKNRWNWYFNTPKGYLSQSIAVSEGDMQYVPGTSLLVVPKALKGSFAENMTFDSSTRTTTVKNGLTGGYITFADPAAAKSAWDIGMNRDGAVFGSLHQELRRKLLANYSSGNFENAEKDIQSYLLDMYKNADQTTTAYSLKDYLGSTNIGKNVAAILGFSAAWTNATSNEKDVWYKQFEAAKALHNTLQQGYDVTKDMPKETMDAMNKFLVSLGMTPDSEGNVFSLANDVFSEMPYKGYFESPQQETFYRGFASNADALVSGLKVDWISALYSQMKRTLQNAGNPYLKALQTPYVDLQETVLKTQNGTFRYMPSENRYINEKYITKDPTGQFIVKDPKAANKKGNYYNYQEAQREAQKYRQWEISNEIENAEEDAIPADLYSWNRPWSGAVGNPSDFQSSAQRSMATQMVGGPTYATNTVTYQPNSVQINVNGMAVPLDDKAKGYLGEIANALMNAASTTA